MLPFNPGGHCTYQDTFKEFTSLEIAVISLDL